MQRRAVIQLCSSDEDSVEECVTVVSSNIAPAAYTRRPSAQSSDALPIEPNSGSQVVDVPPLNRRERVMLDISSTVYDFG